MLRLIERRMYRSADLVTCTTQAFEDTVAERGVGAEKRRLLPNGADVELFRPLPRENEVGARYPFGDRFVVMYSGLLGIKHGLETVLDAAALLREREDIVFFIRGEGPRRQALEQRVAEQKLDNVVFGGELPIEEVPYLLARADVCVTNLLPDPYLEKIVSVKIFEYLACGKPVVGALRGEGARVLEDSGGESPSRRGTRRRWPKRSSSCTLRPNGATHSARPAAATSRSTIREPSSRKRSSGCSAS